jgi:prolyl oligopeptidase
MLRNAALLLLALTLAACTRETPPANEAAQAASKATTSALTYPAAQRGDQVDTYHGVEVADPYRWMENLDDPALTPWIEAQNELLETYLADVPNRARIGELLTKLWDYERFGLPQARNGRYFYTRNDGLQNQAPVYWQQGLDGESKLLLDPNSLSSDGTIALGDWSVSDDGEVFAYALSDGGSDWRTIKLRRVGSGEDLADIIEWAKFTSIAWRKDGSGFFYSRFDQPQGEDELKAVNRFQKLYFHRLGTPQSEDALVYERKDQPEWGFVATVSDDDRYLVIDVSQGTDSRNRLFYKDLSAPDNQVVELIAELESTYEFAGNDGATFFLRTSNGAPNYRLIAIDLARPAPDAWRELVPDNAGGRGTLTGASHVGGKLIARYLSDAHSKVVLYGLDGSQAGEIALPGLGTAAGFDGAPDSGETFYTFAGFTTPPTVYRYDFAAGTSSVFKQPEVGFDPTRYETTQAFYQSKDGTRIPMFITARKGAPRDGSNPTILWGYGGFNIPQTPNFNANTVAWLELGGVFALANLRGGGEYGRAWHEAGMKLVKQNVFDDFAAAAEFLIAEKWTQPDKLAIRGGSNGGLLVAATMMQRPELFGAAVPAVGVLDMLRFREFTIGWAWESDYGSVKNADEFKAIHAYSPLHNLRAGVDYPPTLIVTADRDDRVFPAHSLKFAAELQHQYRGTDPMLIRIETRAGHGAGKPTSKIIEETADVYAFLVKTLGMSIAP